MKILFVKTKLPVLPENPGNPRTFCFAKELSKKHEIHLLIFPENKIKDTDLERIKATGIFKSITLNNPANNESNLARKYLHSLLNKTYNDLSIKDPEYLSQAKALTSKSFQDINADIIFAVGIASAQFIDLQLPTVLDLCDSLSLLASRKTKTARTILEYFSYISLEKNVSKKFKNITFVSDVDRDWFQSFTGHLTSKVIPLGIDLSYFTPETELHKANTIIFTGVMDYEPNRNASEYLVEDIFPLVKSEIKDSELLIVGKSADKIGLSRSDGIIIHSDVSDIRPSLRKVKVYLCPLRLGAGTKNKLLTAMACKVPIVATPLSIEGMGLIENEHCLVGRTKVELAQKTIELLRNDELREKLATNAYKLVEENSWEKVSYKLEKILITAGQQSIS